MSPRGKAPPAIDLPANLTIETVRGEDFLSLKNAARLAGIHPVILEMGTRLLKRVGEEAGIFKLGTPAMKRQADAIEAMFVKGLRQVAAAIGPGGLAVKAYRDGDRLTFWYASGGPGIRKGRAS